MSKADPNLNDETERALRLVGQWLLGSIPSVQLDRLFDHMSSERFEGGFSFAVADELRLALGYEAFDR